MACAPIPKGEAYGDQGYIATVEARLMLAPWAAGAARASSS
jgi:hypothetical protein